MSKRSVFSLFVALLVLLTVSAAANPTPEAPDSRVVVIYDVATIPGNTGISTGSYTKVDGFRYVNVTVEYEQHSATEKPLSLGVLFAFDERGKWGSRRYFTFEENFDGSADPQMVTVTGAASWHGSQTNTSSYTARLPIMGPYVQVFPFNQHEEERQFSIVLYLTD